MKMSIYSLHFSHTIQLRLPGETALCLWNKANTYGVLLNYVCIKNANEYSITEYYSNSKFDIC